ncbi:MAG: outer membrane protein [Novosphingobium sp.]|uniref:outer membrane protein n=1 Tax=Novosphingobium sp. TaxID=1874826 RepID=UPI003B9B5C00
MRFNNLFAWPLAATVALVSVPALAQDASDTSTTTTADGFDRDSHFSGIYIQGFGGLGVPGENGNTFGFDTDRNGTYNEQVTTLAGANAFSPGFCNGARGRTRDPGCAPDKAGAEYGARIGFDARSGGMVFGALVEGSRNEAKERASAFSTTPAFYRIDRSLDYAVSARARVGFTPGGGALFYGTGGVSYAKIDHDFTTSNTANSFNENNDGDMVWGWQAGGGTEVMLTNNVSLGLEYLYSRYKDDKYSVSVGQGTAPATNPFLLNGGGTNMRIQDKYFDTHAVRAVVGLRF